MKRLPIKTSGFSAGRKVFVKMDGETLLSEDSELPTGFLLGVEVPVEPGTYYVQTVAGALLVVVSSDSVLVELIPWNSTSGTGNDYVFSSNFRNLTQKAGLEVVLLPEDVGEFGSMGYFESALWNSSGYWDGPTHASFYEAGDLIVAFNGAYAVNKHTDEVAWLYYEIEEGTTWGDVPRFPNTDRTWGVANSDGNDEYYVGISDWGIEGLYVLKTQTGEAIYRDSGMYDKPYLNEGVHVLPTAQKNKFLLWEGDNWSGEVTPQVYTLEIDQDDTVTITLHPSSLAQSSYNNYLMQGTRFQSKRMYMVDNSTGDYYYLCENTFTKFNSYDLVEWYIDFSDPRFEDEQIYNTGIYRSSFVKAGNEIIMFLEEHYPIVINDEEGTWAVPNVDGAETFTYYYYNTNTQQEVFEDISVEDFWTGWDFVPPKLCSPSKITLPVVASYSYTGGIELFSISLQDFSVKFLGYKTPTGLGYDFMLPSQVPWPIYNPNTGISYLGTYNEEGKVGILGWDENGIVEEITFSDWTHNSFYLNDNTPALMLSESGQLYVLIEDAFMKYTDTPWKFIVNQDKELTANTRYSTRNSHWDPGALLFSRGYTNTNYVRAYEEINGKYYPYSRSTFIDTSTGEGVFSLPSLISESGTTPPLGPPTISTNSSMEILYPTGTPNEFYMLTSGMSGVATVVSLSTINFETGEIVSVSLPNISTGLPSTYARVSFVKRPNGNFVQTYQLQNNYVGLEVRPFEFNGTSWSSKAITTYPSTETVAFGDFTRLVTVYHDDKLYSILFKTRASGDFNVREYDFDTNTWSNYDSIPLNEIPSETVPRYIHAAYRQGTLYFHNGYIYDITGKTLTRFPDFPVPIPSGVNHIYFRNNCVLFSDLSTAHVYALENTPAPY